MRPPQTPDSATWQRRSIYDKGTMYAPTAIGQMTTVTLHPACPMTYQVCPDATYVDTGQPDRYVHITISDLALLDTAKLLNNAVREMRLVRSAVRARQSTAPAPDTKHE